MKSKWGVLAWVVMMLCVIGFVGGVVMGMDAAAPVTPAPAPVPVDGGSVLPGWVVAIINCAEGLLAMVFTFFFGWVIKKAGDNAAEKAALEALRDGVVATYHTLYKELKEAAKDGKLSEAEKAQLRANAIEQAKSLAKGAALELLNTWGKPRLQALVERMVAKMKGSGVPE
jgi:hypothetical protein